MNDFSDLLSEAGNDLERALLRAGRGRAPQAAKERAWLAASSVVGTSALAASGAAASTASAVAKVGTLATLKVVVAITGVVAVTGVAAFQVAYRAPLPAESVGGIAPSAPTRRVLPPRDTRNLTTSHERGVLEAPAPREGPSTAFAAQAPSSVSAAPVAVRPTTSLGAVSSEEGASPVATVAAELALLDQAHQALGANEPARALAILDQYPDAFPHGAMRPEATVLRVEALVKGGDRRAAARAAQALLASSPGSPYARRIESLLTMPNP
jgi:hypothetical protein